MKKEKHRKKKKKREKHHIAAEPDKNGSTTSLENISHELIQSPHESAIKEEEKEEKEEAVVPAKGDEEQALPTQQEQPQHKPTSPKATPKAKRGKRGHRRAHSADSGIKRKGKEKKKGKKKKHHPKKKQAKDDNETGRATESKKKKNKGLSQECLSSSSKDSISINSDKQADRITSNATALFPNKSSSEIGGGSAGPPSSHKSIRSAMKGLMLLRGRGRFRSSIAAIRCRACISRSNRR